MGCVAVHKTPEQKPPSARTGRAVHSLEIRDFEMDSRTEQRGKEVDTFFVWEEKLGSAVITKYFSIFSPQNF